MAKARRVFWMKKRNRIKAPVKSLKCVLPLLAWFRNVVRKKKKETAR